MKNYNLKTLIIFLLSQYFMYGQSMVETVRENKKNLTTSKEFKITTLDTKEVEKRYKEDSNFDGNLNVYLINNKGTKLKEIKVSSDAYENDANVSELKNFNLLNVRKVLKTILSHCACACSSTTYVWFLTKQNKLIQLPVIEEMGYEESGMKYTDYVFSTKYPNRIQLVEYQDGYIEKGNFEPNNIRRKYKKVLKTFFWNGKTITEVNPEQHYIVYAKQGLNIRNNYKLSAQKVGKLPYGTIVKKVADTNIKLTVNDNGKKVKGHWIKIKYNNYTYLTSKETKPKESEGYIFDGYLKKYDNTNTKIDVKKITKQEFTELKTKTPRKPKPLVAIKTLDSVKMFLKGRVNWVLAKNDEYSRDDIIESIITENGQKLITNKLNNREYGFAKGYSAYYPEYGILALEGGHSSDETFSIKTGETTETAGNPIYIVPSPKNTIRLNGYFSGQECVSYFFQIKENEEFVFLTNLDSKYDICTFKQFYWINEAEFIYSKMDYKRDSRNGEEIYFAGKINP